MIGRRSERSGLDGGSAHERNGFLAAGTRELIEYRYFNFARGVSAGLAGVSAVVRCRLGAELPIGTSFVLLCGHRPRTPLFDARSGDESQGLVIDRCEEDLAVRKVQRVAAKHMGEHRCHLGSAICLTAIGRGSSRLDASRRDVGINSLRNP